MLGRLSVFADIEQWSQTYCRCICLCCDGVLNSWGRLPGKGLLSCSLLPFCCFPLMQCPALLV